MKIPDPECIPLFLVSRGLHLPSIIFVNIQSKVSIFNFDNSNVFGSLKLNIKTGEVWFGPLFGCGLCTEVQ